MKYRILTITAAAVLLFTLLAYPAAASDMGPGGGFGLTDNYSALMPRSGSDTASDTGMTDGTDTSDTGMGSPDTTESLIGTDTGDNLGDTSGPTESGDGVIDGTADTDKSPMSDMSGNTDTAGGTADKDGGNLLGIIITLLIIGAVVILIFALIPKRKS